MTHDRGAIVLSGRQITLRDWQTDDLDRFTFWQRPGHRWQELDGPYYPRATVEEVATNAERLRASIATASWPVPRTRLVIADRLTDELRGVVTWYWESAETNWLSVGIVIFDPASWGKGVGYEALGLWSDYLFSAIPAIVRLDLRTWSGNHGMMRLAQKLGYLEEARFRQARIVDGIYYDGMGYGVLRSEWTSRYPDGLAASLPSS